MTRGERRVITRALIVLTVAGLGRVAADARRPPVDVLEHLGDRGAELDSAAAVLAADEELRSRPLAEGERLDPNRASESELDRLPGVGPAVAARIVGTRTEQGGFSSVADLERVPGIGPATLARLSPFLELGLGPRPRAAARSRTGTGEGDLHPRVDVNRADSTALLEVSGIGPALAGRIMALRRERGHISDLEALLEVRGIGEKTLTRLRRHLTVRSGG